jgi:hypothetical protein
MIVGVIVFRVVFAGSLGAALSPEGIEIRTTPQTPVFFGAAVTQPNKRESSSVSSGSLLKAKDDVDPIDRDEFLGEV